jgi:hypothetical protein
MAGQDTAAGDAILKDFYEGNIRDQIRTLAKMYTRFKDLDAKQWGGRRVTYPIRTGRNQGIGAYAEGGSFPTPGRNKYTTVDIPMRYVGGRIRLTSQAMKHSASDRGAFASMFQQEQDGLVEGFVNEFGRMVWSDGRGVLAVVNGDPGTGTTVTVDAPGGFAGATNGTRYINVDELITFVSPATGSLVAAADESVTAVPTTGLTFTIGTAAAAAIADNDYVVRANVAGVSDISGTSYAKEPMGLPGLVDDGTYVATLHGVNRTQYPIYASTVIGTSSSPVGALSSDVIMRGIDLAEQRGGGNINLLAMHHSVRRAYIQLTDSSRRYMGGDLSSPDAGTEAARGRNLTFGGIELEVDKYANYGAMYGLDTSTLVRFVEVAGEWINEDGAILRPVGSGTTFTDEWEAAYRIWQNFHNEYPNKSFRLDGITSQIVVSHIE